MTLEAVFVRCGDGFHATDLARGPWEPGALHGGAPAALLVNAFEGCEPRAELRIVRITYEFMRPVPLGELFVRAQVVRAGRRVMLLEASIRDAGDVEVARARALRVRPSDLGEPAATEVPFPGPERGQVTPFRDTGLPMFATDAMEIRFVRGSFMSPGSSIAWFRLRHPMIAGEPVSQLQRLAAASDFGNGIASVLTWDEHVFINPDLTLYVEREPVGEWVALQSEMRVSPGSVAVAESVLWDEQGRLGCAVQSLLVSRR